MSDSNLESGTDPKAGAETDLERVVAILEQLDGRVSSLEGKKTPASTATAGGPWHWENLGEESTAALWGQLREFVIWLDLNYLSQTPLYQLVPCWYRHPNVVRQITAVMVAHQAAYSEENSDPTGELVYWHEHHLYPTLDRIIKNGSLKKCAANSHQDRTKTKYIEEEGLLRLAKCDEPMALVDVETQGDHNED